MRSALPPPLGSFRQHACVAVGHVDNVDNQFQVASMSMRATWCGQCGQSFCNSPHGPHFLSRQFFLFAWEFPARGFVDNVDNVDARFKLVRDEVST
jgi:hypothetical protein